MDPCLDVSEHGNSYKRMCVEQNIRKFLESFQPGTSDMADMKELCEAVGAKLVMLSASQLLTPTIMVPAGQALGGGKVSPPLSGASTPLEGELSRASSPESGPSIPDEIDMVTPANHIDFSNLLPLFPNMEKIMLTFQTKKCGVDFRWNMFGMTEKLSLIHI